MILAFSSKMASMCLLVSVSSSIIIIEVGKGDLSLDPGNIWVWIWCFRLVHLCCVSNWRMVWSMETGLTIEMDLTVLMVMMVAMLGWKKFSPGRNVSWWPPEIEVKDFCWVGC